MIARSSGMGEGAIMGQSYWNEAIDGIVRDKGSAGGRREREGRAERLDRGWPAESEEEVLPSRGGEKKWVWRDSGVAVLKGGARA